MYENYIGLSNFFINHKHIFIYKYYSLLTLSFEASPLCVDYSGYVYQIGLQT